MNTTLLRTLLCGVILMAGCGGDDSTDDDGGPLTTLDAVIDGDNSSLNILDAVASKSGIQGVQLILSTDSDGAADTAVAQDERQLRIKVLNIADVAADAAITICTGGNGCNVTSSFDDDDVHMIGTSGTVTFEQIGNEDEETVKLTFDIGYVSTGDVNNPHTANVSGSLTIKVSE